MAVPSVTAKYRMQCRLGSPNGTPFSLAPSLTSSAFSFSAETNETWGSRRYVDEETGKKKTKTKASYDNRSSTTSAFMHVLYYVGP